MDPQEPYLILATITTIESAVYDLHFDTEWLSTDLKQVTTALRRCRQT